MCGIVGVTGADDALGVILDGLRRLEYRGYDSAGVVLASDADLWRSRAAEGTHSVADLAIETVDAPLGRRSGIGHTRWATHGQPTERNAHPHLDCTGTVAVVHNGIIENHAALAASLRQAGHVLASDTDSEVLSHLIEDRIAEGDRLVDALRAALQLVEGTFAVACISTAEPEVIAAARRVSPLVVGLDGRCGVLASDIPALLEHATELYAVDDEQVVELRPGSMCVTTLDGAPSSLTRLTVEWSASSCERDGFDDFMTKEIHEQPAAVAATLLGHLAEDGSVVLGDSVGLNDCDLLGIERVSIVACGSSYHAGLIASYALESWARLPTDVVIASEFRSREPVLDSRSLVVGVSQSGETVDTLQGLREARLRGAPVLVVSNVVDSSMARESDGVLYTRAGPEIGVAATKTHLTQIVALELLALSFAQVRGTMSSETIALMTSQLRALPEVLATVLERTKDVASVAEELFAARDLFYLGRHVGFPVALEGALKAKEISYLRAEGYAAGELKHGPIALIAPGTVVVAVATRSTQFDKLCSSIEEVKSRGATVVLVGNDGDTRVAEMADHVLWVPAVEPMLSPIVDSVPLQLLAYWLAQVHGRDVDRPRNLAKTVTVE